MSGKRGGLLGRCSPWQELKLVLFPGWVTRPGAALGLGVPQLTVNPVSDSERRGYHSSDPSLTPSGWRNPGGQGNCQQPVCLPSSPKPRPSHIPGKNRAREGQVRAQVSFLPARLQLSMALEAPGLL